MIGDVGHVILTQTARRQNLLRESHRTVCLTSAPTRSDQRSCNAL